jgi:hypothetical protein
MKETRILFQRLFAGAALLLVGGCTYYVPAKLEASRAGDILTVQLAGPGAARWDPRKDSLVLQCPGCMDETAQLVDHFLRKNEAQYDIASSEGLMLILYTMGHSDTTLLPGTAANAEVTSKPRFTPHHYHAAATPEPTPSEVKAAMEAKAAAEAKATADAKAAATEKALKKTTLLKVTATEGVAVYKDKTKREVLKSLPHGSTIILLAREGDLYSVSVDGEEGFVDAEAVKEQE